MERIHVTVRSRPLSAEDAKSSPWRISGSSIYLANQSAKFEFDRVSGEECKTREVYEARTKDIVASAVRGFNGTVFAYGQTNSGKTHTMRGSEAEPGIIPLAVHDLFQILQENTDREFLVRIAYMEIYNEEINDLLTPEHRRLQIHESLERGIFVAGLKEEIVASPEQVLDLMEKGESNRHIGETNMNLHSSRSHTIFRMTVESREKTDDSLGVDYLCDAVRVSVLNLVDLAGSERAAKTGAEGVRLKEGSHINKSLMTLGTVIKKLSEGAESQGGHVPYRDSKLTRILQPALGGNANTAIICNITLAQIHTEETKSSLQFASRAIRVTNCVCVNEILTDAALLKRQRKEIEELRASLASHSEHWEQEILNLRNTLLQSELEKERIALELEEEKRAKAQLEKRLQEQIANLSSMVFGIKGDDQSTDSAYTNKNKKQKTWCAGPLTLKASNDVRGEEDMHLPLPFEDLVRESEVAIPDITPNNFLTVESTNSCDDFSLPDAHALLHVTSRRKVHCRKASSSMGKETHIETENTERELECSQGEKSVESGCITGKDSRCSLGGRNATVCHQRESDLSPNKYAIIKELDAMPVVNQLREQENMIASSMELLIEIQDIAFELQRSRNIVEEISSVAEDIFRSFSDISKAFLELREFAPRDIEKFKFIGNCHKELYYFLKRKSDERETEKHLLHQQTIDLQKQIQEHKFDAQEREKAMVEAVRRHESEKDELCCLILALQKEVSCLSSSSLTKEKETLRKELEKTKSKLRDTESKLKNTIQEKVRLESEKAHAEREIKHLHGQRAILERDVTKRDSLARCEPKASDFSKSKGHGGPASKTLQGDYEKLEIYAFEMEAEIASLEEKLIASIGEKEEAVARNGILGSELEVLSNELNTANSELKLMEEEIASLNLGLDEYKSLCQRLETSHDAILKEKEEMAMQLTDALLEFEANKSTWAVTEKALVESGEKSRDKVAMLSEDLLKEALNNNIEKTKLRVRLRSTQAKLDAFRGRYIEAIDENERMNMKFEEASGKLKEKLASKCIEILNLKKQLSTKDELDKR